MRAAEHVDRDARGRRRLAPRVALASQHRFRGHRPGRGARPGPGAHRDDRAPRQREGATPGVPAVEQPVRVAAEVVDDGGEVGVGAVEPHRVVGDLPRGTGQEARGDPQRDRLVRGLLEGPGLGGAEHRTQPAVGGEALQEVPGHGVGADVVVQASPLAPGAAVDEDAALPHQVVEEAGAVGGDGDAESRGSEAHDLETRGTELHE